MAIKSIIALIMGLVIQLSQAQLFAQADCFTPLHEMNCCSGMKSCPCAGESDSNSKPHPIVQVEVDLKLLISKSEEATPSASQPSAKTAIALAPLTERRAPSGFAGVTLSVAFCTFVI
jgi:hypothetical protein